MEISQSVDAKTQVPTSTTQDPSHPMTTRSSSQKRKLDVAEIGTPSESHVSKRLRFTTTTGMNPIDSVLQV